ncbi:phosphatase PAP2 family protein [Parvimonas sp. G1604]|uniref:phosphatase PAP2 family protein n=1 Tax=Parvimonas sp. G1604 TaxID=3388845 RepID=UPI0039800243
MEKLKLRQLIILFSIVVLCSVLFGFYLKSVKLTDSFDYKLMSFVQSNNIFTKNTILLNFIKFITSLGSGIGCFILLIPMGIYFYFNDLKKDFIFLVCSLLITYILNELIKHIVLRKRPIEFFIINVAGYSYPSGHSMNISAFYLTFRFLLNRKKKNRYLDIFIYVLIIMIALSRVILGVHWPTDVIVGLTLGYLSYRLSKEIYLNFWRD